jgi:hypothetical protein
MTLHGRNKQKLAMEGRWDELKKWQSERLDKAYCLTQTN